MVHKVEPFVVLVCCEDGLVHAVFQIESLRVAVQKRGHLSQRNMCFILDLGDSWFSPQDSLKLVLDLLYFAEPELPGFRHADQTTICGRQSGELLQLVRQKGRELNAARFLEVSSLLLGKLVSLDTYLLFRNVCRIPTHFLFDETLMIVD